MTAKRPKDVLGHTGEHHAKIMLEAHGYVHLMSNWYCSAGELDLIMLDGENLVFVEVKTRRGVRAGRADDAITPAKSQRMMAAAEWFVAEHPEHHDRIWRCDLVAITLDERSGRVSSNHYINAVVSG